MYVYADESVWNKKCLVSRTIWRHKMLMITDANIWYYAAAVFCWSNREPELSSVANVAPNYSAISYRKRT